MDHLLNEIMQLTSQNLHDAECVLEITKEMKEHILKQDIDSLNRAIDERQKRMKKIDFLNAAIKKKVEELLKQLSIHGIEDIDKVEYPQVESIIDKKTKIKKIYGHAYEMDKVNYKNAEFLLKEWKDAINGLHINKKAMRAYGSNRLGQSILINRVK